MLIQLLVFSLFIDSIVSKTNQQDLSIANYSHIACVKPYSEREFIFNNIQENILSSYQTFHSRNLTVELCFRLCRRWIVILNRNHTNCICLYTVSEIYEINEHLGEVSSIDRCSTNTFEIYSITKEPYILSSPGPSDDWSLEGCYYLHGIQTHHANLILSEVNHTQALSSCKKHCETVRGTSYFSFFLSLRKYCYCLPIKIGVSVTTIGIRKPLVHCSFLPEIQTSFSNSFNLSEIHVDTVVKINHQRYCPASFVFDRKFYLCLKVVLRTIFTSYNKISSTERCSPLLIKTVEQWNNLMSFSSILRSSTYVWIDRRSTYLSDDLFKSQADLFSSSMDICLIINPDQTPIFRLTLCSNIHLFTAYIFCIQKPYHSAATDESDFKTDKSILPIYANMTCPSRFNLFDNVCYYVDSSFVYTNHQGEQICSNRYANSTLVTFQSHEWGNVNTTRFLGRFVDDALIEFVYYQLENQLRIENPMNSTNKHWLRLLIRDKNISNSCVLRYYVRSSGAFTVLHRCIDGGHPVCQTDPIPVEINIDSTTTISPDTSTTSTTTIEIILSNETLSDEDLIDNETDINSPFAINNEKQTMKSKYSRYIFVLFTIGPLIVSCLLVFGVALFVSYCRRSRGSYSTQRRSINIFRRKKRSPTPTTTTSTESISNTPAVLYKRLPTSPPTIAIDADMNEVFDDNVQLLPTTFHQINTKENIIPEENEEPIYATLKLPNEK